MYSTSYQVWRMSQKDAIRTHVTWCQLIWLHATVLVSFHIWSIWNWDQSPNELPTVASEWLLPRTALRGPDWDHWLSVSLVKNVGHWINLIQGPGRDQCPPTHVGGQQCHPHWLSHSADCGVWCMCCNWNGVYYSATSICGLVWVWSWNTLRPREQNDCWASSVIYSSIAAFVKSLNVITKLLQVWVIARRVRSRWVGCVVFLWGGIFTNPHC